MVNVVATLLLLRTPYSPPPCYFQEYRTHRLTASHSPTTEGKPLLQHRGPHLQEKNRQHCQHVLEIRIILAQFKTICQEKLLSNRHKGLWTNYRTSDTCNRAQSHVGFSPRWPPPLHLREKQQRSNKRCYNIRDATSQGYLHKARCWRGGQLWQGQGIPVVLSTVSNFITVRVGNVIQCILVQSEDHFA